MEERSLLAVYVMYKEKIVEVDYWGGDECGLRFRARANCLWHGGAMTVEGEEGCQTCGG